MRKRRKGFERAIARERMELLFNLAVENAIKGRMSRAHRYAWLIRKIGMRYNVRLPWYMRRRICRSCNRFMMPGKNSRVRFHDGRVVITCLHCGRVYRIPHR